ncbi:MFS transporter [Okibacterium endophyticum]
MTTTTPVPTVLGTEATRFPLGKLVILSAAVMAAVTAEMIPAGVLPEMAASFGVQPLQIGVLVTVWALTTIIVSIPLARLTASVDRRLVIGVSFLIFAGANALTALAPSYEVAFASRVIAAAAHGLFWAIVLVYAGQLVSGSHLGRAISIVAGGVALTNVIGLPLGTALAHALDWRMTFAAIALLMAIVAVVVFTRMPSVTPGTGRHDGGVRFWRDPSALPVLGAGLTTSFLALAHTAMFTYITPYLSQSAGFGGEWTSVLLLVFGAAGAGGLIASGFVADRWPAASLAYALVLFTVAFVMLAAVPGSAAVVVAGVALWGLAFGALPPLAQTRTLRLASDRLRPVASASLVVFFNLGIGTGAFVGGMLDVQSGPASIALFAAGMSAVALIVAVGTTVSARRRAAVG